MKWKVLIFIIALLWPLAVIWAANTLFALGIAYNFWTWLAVVVISSTFGRSVVNVNTIAKRSNLL